MKHLFLILIALSFFACKSTSNNENESYPCPVYDEDLQDIEGITETDAAGHLIGEIDARDWHFGQGTFSFSAKPVEISHFSVYLENDTLKVHWITECETDNASWNIYKSQEEIFEQAEKINPSPIDGEGTTSEVTEYYYIDQSGYEYGETYFYWLESIDYSDTSNFSEPYQFDVLEFTFGPAYPNPSSAEIKIPYTLAYESNVTIIIIDAEGKLISTLISDNQSAGEGEVIWFPEDIDPGIYRSIFHVSENYHWHGDILIQ